MKKRAGRKRPWIFASQLGFLALLLLMIQITVDKGWISQLFLASPMQFAGSLWKMFSTGMIWEHIGISMQEYIIGFGMSVFWGILLGTLVANNRGFDDFTRPFFAAIMSIPKVALMPLLIIWFGIGVVSTVILVFMFCFFTIFYNTVSGIKQTPVNYLKVARVFEATDLQIIWKVQLPSAMPTIFAGIRVAASIGFVGTIFSEMQASRAGVGNLLQRASSLYKTDDSFAIIALVTLLSVGMIKLIDLIEKYIVLKYKAHG